MKINKKIKYDSVNKNNILGIKMSILHYFYIKIINVFLGSCYNIKYILGHGHILLWKCVSNSMKNKAIRMVF